MGAAERRLFVKTLNWGGRGGGGEGRWHQMDLFSLPLQGKEF